MRIVLLGPPGSGKGTQAVKLAAKLGAAHIATGDLFRTEIAEETELGILANEYISHGNLVPNDVTNAMVESRLTKNDADGFVLDGYPRTLDQADALEAALEKLQRPLDGAFLIDVPDGAIVERAVGRLLCNSCGAIYHLKFKPPQVAGVCDICRGILSVRDDDTPSTVRHRLVVYHRITAPLLEFYGARGLLMRIDGVGNPDEIFNRLVAAIEAN
ncbi:Adenylate kinase [Abditibacterium utsteinense]|uniref:Adenylate kinase n=1 Tax=Abditibacterium utsteinense TaxID=1960156 RepID=A0A2S8ST46_9BACT|nr:adenylate kinase [Abditibacterium utsteinense]PQV63967.1 Adenylate kinase [Abditibacterium utsteinense]